MRTSAAIIAAQIDALNTAITALCAAPEKSTDLNGQAVTYQDLPTLQSSLEKLERNYATASGSPGMRRRRLRRVGP